VRGKVEPPFLNWAQRGVLMARLARSTSSLTAKMTANVPDNGGPRRMIMECSS